MSTLHSSVDIKGYTLKIFYDESPESPREWDNLGRIAYKSSRYTLGEEEISDPCDWLIDKLEYTEVGVKRILERELMNNHTDEFRKFLEAKFLDKFIALPVYIYEHSGISLSTTPFGCRWDSGQVGYIYCTVAEAKAEGWKKEWLDGRSIRQAALDVFRGAIETFSQYLNGDVYGFELENPDGDEIYSCWGFFGDDGIKQLTEECEYIADDDIARMAVIHAEIVESLKPV